MSVAKKKFLNKISSSQGIKKPPEKIEKILRKENTGSNKVIEKFKNTSKAKHY